MLSAQMFVTFMHMYVVYPKYLLVYINKIQRDASMQVFIYCKITLHVSGVYRTHHQEYIKL